MTQPLTGKKALVTGATRGIGRAIAERLLTDGATVTVTGTRPEGEPPVGCTYAAVDFDDTAATQAFADTVADLAPDILVNNAGIGLNAPFAEMPLDLLERTLRVNLTAPFLLCRAAIPGMRAAGWGRIVNISSIWGKISKAHRAAYSASKFGLDGLSVGLAAEVAEHGILVNCVAPGFIDTELTRRNQGEAGIATLTAQVPARRLGQVDEIAALVAWLSGPENTYINGQNIAIDGGFTRV